MLHLWSDSCWVLGKFGFLFMRWWISHELQDERLSLASALQPMTDAPACPYDAPTEAALAGVHAHEGPLLIDLDETLYLRNSTEDFIDCTCPGLLALLLLRALEVLRPWSLTGGAATRDTWRVCVVSLFFPWTHWRWRVRVKFLGERYTNQELRVALIAQTQTRVILTNGFGPVVKPLLAAMGFADTPCVAARMFAFADRRDGKLRMAIRSLGAETVASSLVLTDSVGDLELLSNCARPLRTVWPGARFNRALSSVYLPGEYISHIKRPGERYIARGILQEDFAFWLLCSIGLASDPWRHLGGLLLLLLSFWAIYERGYVDNDYIAARYEADPNLSSAVGLVQVATPAAKPWIWAFITGAGAVELLHPRHAPFAVCFIIWIALLICTHVCFKAYNRLDKTTRVWIYPLLQFARSAAFVAIVPLAPVGVAALGAHVLARWVPYHVYRLASRRWPVVRPELVRIIAFMLLLLLTVCAFGISVLLTWTTLLLLLWNAFRAHRDAYAVFESAWRLDRSPRLTETLPKGHGSGSQTVIDQ